MSRAKQWFTGPGWARLPLLAESLAQDPSTKSAAAQLLARGASSSAWAAGETLYEGPVPRVAGGRVGNARRLAGRRGGMPRGGPAYDCGPPFCT
jgi:hypothetical protein